MPAARAQRPVLTKEQKDARAQNSALATSKIVELRDSAGQAINDIATAHNKPLDWVSARAYQPYARTHKVSRWNAFCKAKLDEENARRAPLQPALSLKSNMLANGPAISAEWKSMTDIEKNAYDNLAKKIDSDKTAVKFKPRQNAKARERDVSNTFTKLRQHLEALNMRTSAECCVMVVRNSIQDQFTPQVFSTNKASAFLEKTMKAAPEQIALRMEGLVTSGYNFQPQQLAPNDDIPIRAMQSRQELISSARGLIVEGLLEILSKHGLWTKKTKPVMHYVDYEHEIVRKYGVVLKGYPKEPICNVGELGGGKRPIAALIKAIETKACRWEKLSKREYDERMKSNDEREARGEKVYRVKKSKNQRKNISPEEIPSDNDDE